MSKNWTDSVKESFELYNKDGYMFDGEWTTIPPGITITNSAKTYEDSYYIDICFTEITHNEELLHLKRPKYKFISKRILSNIQMNRPKGTYTEEEFNKLVLEKNLEVDNDDILYPSLAEILHEYHPTYLTNHL